MFNNCSDGRSFQSFSNNLEDFDSIRSVLLYRFVGCVLFDHILCVVCLMLFSATVEELLNEQLFLACRRGFKELVRVLVQTHLHIF